MSNESKPTSGVIHRRPPGGDEVPVGDIRFDDQTKEGTKSVRVTLHGTKNGVPTMVTDAKPSENARHDALYFFGPTTPYYNEVFNVIALHAEIEVFSDPERTMTQVVPVDWASNDPNEVLGGGTLAISPDNQGKYYASLHSVSPI